MQDTRRRICRKQTENVNDVLWKALRMQGLEMPLLQHRVMYAWNQVVGETVARYTGDMRIQNQTLFVKITSPALRQDLSMMRTQLVKRLNDAAGAMVITDIRFF